MIAGDMNDVDLTFPEGTKAPVFTPRIVVGLLSHDPGRSPTGDR